MAKLQLRPAQQQVIADISAAFRAGHKRVMVSASCGFGKSELATAVLQAAAANGKRGAFVADRRALVEQISQRFDKYELDHGVLMADHPRFRPSALVQACSAQTISRRGRWPADLKMIVVDEAHLLIDAVKKKLQAADTYAIGLSATPITPGLGKYFDTVVNAPTTNELIAQGLLVPVRTYSCKAPDMNGVKVVGTGEWEDKGAEKKVLEIVGDVVAEYIKRGEGKQFICFAHTINHAQELSRQFLAAGIPTATYTAFDKDDYRSETLAEFKAPNSTLRGLISVEALTRGFDAAQVEVLIMARPLRKALHVFIQMLGRVMRASPETGKKEAILLCHSGNAARFWHEWHEMFENGVQELDDGKPKPKAEKQKPKEKEPVKCPSCEALHMPAKSCPECGHEYPAKPSIQHVPGELIALVPGATSPRQAERDLYSQLAGYAISLGKEGDAARRLAQVLFKDFTGDFARVRWESVKPAPVSAEVRQRIVARQIRRRYAAKAAAKHEARRAA